MEENSFTKTFGDNLFDKVDAVQRRVENFLSGLQKLESGINKYNKSHLKFQKSSRFKLNEIKPKDPLYEMFSNFSNISNLEKKATSQYIERNQSQLKNIARLRKYIENNRKVLSRRQDKNEKNYTRKKKQLESLKRKQHQHAKEAHEYFIKHDQLQESAVEEKQDVRLANMISRCEFQFIHAAQEEERFSRQYKNVVNQLKNYQDDYVKEHKEVLNRYEEFDRIVQNRIKMEFLSFVEERKQYLRNCLEKMNQIEKDMLTFDVKQSIQTFIEKNENKEFQLEEKHEYEPFIPIYKQSIRQRERILQQKKRKGNHSNDKKSKKITKLIGGLIKKNQSKDTPKKSKTMTPRKSATGGGESRSSVGEGRGSYGGSGSSAGEEEGRSEEEDNNGTMKRRSTADDYDLEGRKKEEKQQAKSPEIIWFEAFYLKLTDREDILSNMSEISDILDIDELLTSEDDDDDDDEDEDADNEENDEDENEDDPVKEEKEEDNALTDEEKRQSKRKKKMEEDDFEKKLFFLKEKVNGYGKESGVTEYGVTEEALKQAFDYLDSKEGRLGFALALNYQRHTPYIQSRKAFEKLGELFEKCLYKSMDEEDKDVGKMLLNMCQTFYTMEKDEQLFYYQYLKHLDIWRDIRFWRGCFYDTMSQMRMKSLTYSKKWRDLDEGSQQEAMQEHANMTFGVLTSFVFQMMQADIPEKEVKQFVVKMCEINSLPPAHIEMIMSNFEEMLSSKATLIPPLN